MNFRKFITFIGVCISLIIILVMVVGMHSVSQGKGTHSSDINVWEYKYKDHIYIIFNVGYGQTTVLHSPDCDALNHKGF